MFTARGIGLEGWGLVSDEYHPPHNRVTHGVETTHKLAWL